MDYFVPSKLPNLFSASYFLKFNLYIVASVKIKKKKLLRLYISAIINPDYFKIEKECLVPHLLHKCS